MHKEENTAPDHQKPEIPAGHTIVGPEDGDTVLLNLDGVIDLDDPTLTVLPDGTAIVSEPDAG